MPKVLPRLQQALAERYRLDREIGQGGMAVVFLAHALRRRALSYTGRWLPDGSGLVTTAADLRQDPNQPDSSVGGGGTDAAINRKAGKGPLEPLVASRFDEQFVGVSPDGRWISFVSNQSGREEVYVRDLAGERDQLLVSPTVGASRSGAPTGGSCSTARRGRTTPTWSRPGSPQRRRSR